MPFGRPSTVLLHAIADAILGAAAAGEIGALFPPSDPATEGIASERIVAAAVEKVTEAGYRVGNVDAKVIAEEPRLADHLDKLRHNIARMLDVDPEQVSVKARTNEAGRFQAVAPRAVVDDLLSFVFRIKRFLDRIAVLLALSTAAFTGLVLWLSTRLRAEEFHVLDAIGCARGMVLRLAASEVALLTALGLIVALAAVAATLTWMPDLVRTL